MLSAQVGGWITGTVKDPTGAKVSGAAEVAVNATSGVKQETKANDQGVYSFPALAVGQYNIGIRAPGFTPYRKTGVMIDVNSAPQLDVTLEVAGQLTTVDVSEEATQVQVERSDTQLARRFQPNGSKRCLSTAAAIRIYSQYRPASLQSPAARRPARLLAAGSAQWLPPEG